MDGGRPPGPRPGAPQNPVEDPAVKARRMRIILAITAVLFLAILGLVGYFSWINIAYVDTLHARIEGSILQVRAPAAGRVGALPLEVGDSVALDEEVGALETVSPSGGQALRVVVPIRATMSGLVTEVAAREGDFVAAGQVLLTLVDPDGVWVTANIHESRVPQLRLGQSARVKVRVRTLRRKFWGRVEQIGRVTSGAISSQGRLADVSTPRLSEVPIRVTFDPQGYIFLPGMTVEVRVRLDPRPLLTAR